MTKVIALAATAIDRMAGGIERNIAYLAKHLVDSGYTVILITFDLEDAESFYELPTEILWEKIGRKRAHAPISKLDRLRLAQKIRVTLKKHSVDTIICFHHGIVLRFLLAAAFTNIKTICSERNSLRFYDYTRARRRLPFYSLWWVDKITVQFPSYIADYPKILRHKIAVVPNPVSPIAFHNIERERIILGVGRLCAQKQLSIIIEAFSLIRSDFADWRVIIVGSGPQEGELRKMIKRHSLEDYVLLEGPTSEIGEFYAKARYYCQPSLWEGFPNAQAEAMASGVVPIGFSETCGVADLIQDGKNGYIVEGRPSAEALAGTLRTALSDEGDWSRLSSNARKVADDYSPDRWRIAWNSVIS
jgi:GalNAc-alpha-(1->4)-GalNAc-alpha-(1->3)-diNAcBac-PP-undecaprenol alpha-1,4-N-acetyl-D-galactosaminyltransferase